VTLGTTKGEPSEPKKKKKKEHIAAAARPELATRFTAL